MSDHNGTLQTIYKELNGINSNEKHLTILVTGCSGFIGSHLVDGLLEEGENSRYEVRCMSRNIESVEGFFNK